MSKSAIAWCVKNNNGNCLMLHTVRTTKMASIDALVGTDGGRDARNRRWRWWRRNGATIVPVETREVQND